MYLNWAVVRVSMGYARGVVAAAALFGPLAVTAQPVGMAGSDGAVQIAEQDLAYKQGLGIQIGYNSDYKKVTLAYETPKIWAHQFQNGWGRVDLNVELGVSYWEAKRTGPKSMGQLSAIPMLRWWPSESYYLELGSGPTLLSRTKFAGHDLSTGLQFGSHFGAGVLIQKAHQIGIRYSHYSNASIKKPNPGLDLLEVAYLYRF